MSLMYNIIISLALLFNYYFFNTTCTRGVHYGKNYVGVCHFNKTGNAIIYQQAGNCRHAEIKDNLDRATSKQSPFYLFFLRAFDDY